jgi:hypothetical protein
MTKEEWNKYKDLEYYPDRVCKCGCGGRIKVQPHHKYQGIPEYIRGHHMKTDEHRQRVRRENQERPKSKESNKKRGQTLRKYYKDHPEAVERISRKVSKSLQGHSVSKETREKQRKAKLGKKRGPHSEEHKRNIRISLQDNENLRRGNSLAYRIAKDPLYLVKISGENASNWQGGIGNFPYSFEFNEEFKILIRERDNNTCQLCGKTKEQEGRNLCVHHIYYDKENSCSDENDFTALCHSCNAKVNFNREYWIEFFQSKLTIVSI